MCRPCAGLLPLVERPGSARRRLLPAVGRFSIRVVMGQELKSVHVRLCDEAHQALKSEAQIREKDIAEMARLILEEALLGRIHTVRLIARRYARAGTKGSNGD